MNLSFYLYWFMSFGLILARYLLIAGGTYFFFYWLIGKSKTRQRIETHPHLGELMRKDIQLSVLSTGVFALGAAFTICCYDWGITRLYSDIDKYGLWYLGLSFMVVLIAQDTYFYFFHRIFHHPLLFRWLHSGHHRSKEPTPWTSFAFDPPEAVIQALFLLGIVFIIPIHFITLLALLITMTIWAVLNHLELRMFPSWFPHHWLGRWIIGPSHHSIHHLKYTVHYGLYFTFWDKLLGTQDPNYQS